MAAVCPASLFPFRRKGCSDVLIGCLSGKTAARGTGEEADLHEIRLADIFDGRSLFADSGRNSVDPDRTAIEFMNDRLQDLIIQIIKSDLIDMKRSQRLCGNIRRDRAPLHLRKVSDALQKAIRDYAVSRASVERSPLPRCPRSRSAGCALHG